MKKLLSMLCMLMLVVVAPALGGNTERNFGGVGIDGVPRSDGSIVVRQLVLGGPAQLAGVRVGDVITHIDGKATRGSNFKEMVQHRLRGVAGTKVSIRIVREGKPLTFTLTRRQLALKGGK